MTPEYRPHSSSRASRMSPSISSRRDFPSSESICGEQGSSLDDSDRIHRSKAKRHSLTRGDYPRERVRRGSRASEHHLPHDMIWENGATPEEVAAAQRKERRSLREKEREREREKEREKERKEEEKRLAKMEKRERRRRERAMSHASKPEHNPHYDSQTETVDSIASLDESVVPIVDVFLEPEAIHEGVPLPGEFLQTRSPTSTTTESPEESIQNSSIVTISESEGPSAPAPTPEEPVAKPPLPTTPKQRPRDPVKSHRHTVSIDSTNSTSTLRPSSNEASPTAGDISNTAPTHTDQNTGVSPSSTSDRQPLTLLPPIPATSAFYPPPDTSDVAIRPRARRPYSFSASTSYDQPPTSTEPPRARTPHHHHRHSSNASQYPPPYSVGYQFPFPPPDPYRVGLGYCQYPPPPPLAEYTPYPSGPQGTESQYATPGDQRHNPFQYMDPPSDSSPTQQQAALKSPRQQQQRRRRHSSVSFSPTNESYEAYPSLVGSDAKKNSIEEKEEPVELKEDAPAGEQATTTPGLDEDHHSTATSYYSTHSHKRSRSASVCATTPRSPLSTAGEEIQGTGSIPEEPEPESAPCPQDQLQPQSPQAPGSQYQPQPQPSQAPSSQYQPQPQPSQAPSSQYQPQPQPSQAPSSQYQPQPQPPQAPQTPPPPPVIDPYSWYPLQQHNDPTNIPAPLPSPPPSLPARSPAQARSEYVYPRTHLPLQPSSHAMGGTGEVEGGLGVYRRFGGLHHRVLRQLEREVVELESKLVGLENDDGREEGLCVEDQKANLLSEIGGKLQEYNKALKAYRATMSIPAPPHTSFLNPTTQDPNTEPSRLEEDPAEWLYLDHSSPYPPLQTHNPQTPTPLSTISPAFPTPTPFPPSPAAERESTLTPTPVEEKPTPGSLLPIPLVITGVLQLITIASILLAPHLPVVFPTITPVVGKDQCPIPPPPMSPSNWPAVLALGVVGVIAVGVAGRMEERGKGKGKNADGAEMAMMGKWGPAVGLLVGLGLGMATGR